MVADFFHNLYNNTFSIKSRILIKIKVPAILRLLILQSGNVIIPVVYFLTRNKPVNSLYYDVKSNNEKKHTDFVVSLTSFPQRIAKVHLVVESLLRQTYQPKRIILWLSEEQFSSLNDLPVQLLKLQKRGLEIYLTPGDLRSYKKYFFLLKAQPDVPFIIVDDDIFYLSKAIEYLVTTHMKYPNAICANRCKKIEINKPYIQWPSIKGDVQSGRFDLIPTGCGGVLYPSNSLHSDAKNEKLFLDICKDADDIWLNCMAFLNSFPIAYTGKNEYLLAVKSLNNVHLHSKNVGESNNDKRIASVKKYFLNKNGIDVFNRIHKNK
jgi:hypothetical protein